MSRWLRFRVRIDRVVAALLLLPAAPLLAVGALLVRRDGGPAFVRVPRIGAGGRPFDLVKLRTMEAGPGGLAPGLTLAVGTGDARITPIGRHLRRWRVDELANLVNVVRGEMALLGPRPEAPAYVDSDDPRWTAVLAAPPAVAGPTQVLVEAWEARLLTTEGADAYRVLVLPVKLAIDAWYVREASPRIDLAVLRGLLGWASRTGASGLERRVAAAVPEIAAIR